MKARSKEPKIGSLGSFVEADEVTSASIHRRRRGIFVEDNMRGTIEILGLNGRQFHCWFSVKKVLKESQLTKKELIFLARERQKMITRILARIEEERLERRRRQ